MLGVQSRAGHQHFEVRSEPGNVFDETKEDVGVQGSLVGLIYDEHTGRREGSHMSDWQNQVTFMLPQNNTRSAILAINHMQGPQLSSFFLLLYSGDTPKCNIFGCLLVQLEKTQYTILNYPPFFQIFNENNVCVKYWCVESFYKVLACVRLSPQALNNGRTMCRMAKNNFFHLDLKEEPSADGRRNVWL